MTVTFAAPAVAAIPTGYVVACPDCRISGGPYAARAEAELLAGRHDQVLHRGRPTAEVVDHAACESCRTAPATATWSHPSAGAPFALCARCLPTARAAECGATTSGEIR